jgi:SAM-dependent methyltransferase
MTVYDSKRLARTAIHRRAPSLPVRLVYDAGLLAGRRVLDFGCGHGADVRYLHALGVDVTGYDPYWLPERPTGTFDAVLCFYVVNVLSVAATRTMLADLRTFLAPGGTAYIAARSDLSHGGANVQRDVTSIPDGEPWKPPRYAVTRMWTIQGPA